MARNGYPNAADRLFYPQLEVWNTIQAYNSTAAADSAWATDPHGLTGCLQSLSNPPGVHWVEFADPTRDTVMFDMLYWMNQREYPSPVLVNQGGHWVVVVAYETDVEPLGGSSPTLQSIKYHDPEPHNVGTVTSMTGSQWYSGPWNGSIIYSGTWFNQYVAVVEPPIETGQVRARRVTRVGKKLLSSTRAVEYAKRWIKELNLAEQSEYSLLAHRNVDALEPLLVRDEPLGGRSRSIPHYYVVPFGFKEEFDERSTRLARVAVLVNAYTGNFEEVTAFGSPIRYLSEDEALEVVASALRVGRRQLKGAEATLMFQPSDIGHIRAYPFWRIKVDKRLVYVDQLGVFYGKLWPSIPGD